MANCVLLLLIPCIHIWFDCLGHKFPLKLFEVILHLSHCIFICASPFRDFLLLCHLHIFCLQLLHSCCGPCLLPGLSSDPVEITSSPRIFIPFFVLLIGV